MIRQLKQFNEFIRSYATGGSILVICIIIALLIANTGLNLPFNNLLQAHLGPYPTIGWINDGLMAIFFLLVGLEIKDEALNGELSNLRSATLPVFAAVGGMLVPALLYYLVNHNTATAQGWGIPMATDIAFVVAIINVIKSKVPLSLQVFIKALAIVDDLGAILVIALFYSAGINLTYLALAAGTFGLQLLFNKLNIRHIWVYLVTGVFLWYFIHHTGIHATVAGVLTAMAIPYKTKDNYSPLKKLIHLLENPVNFLIIPVFALANANINIAEGLKGGNAINPLSAGILLGLILGKPIGITVFSWLAVKLRLSQLAHKVKWVQVWGIGQLAGIGFTMSIFITLLSFNNAAIQNEAKLTILVASSLTAFMGYMLLKSVKNK
ncbi:Na+/H+ antiporter NhaA [Mucilaginibacter phyllosphaerae]|uniref:Na(+)/H(+) antiporter NhaA n=1 Tax=Mucilaginibacter phyllosphaerae TaxID=1812349 RepID=A0A4Y8ABG8_9SPHI|nr:Na+/H+ antiporter NhaA [Mucilaginibacter phyllosphaerae]MBB3969281.1 NhaA family Na+:H+ antiporter [Mucilaginibacter phyllosphaerae]TEW65921.1 Na+/H+ antiporter NhaA [Mucilaginibacter phyllosphaerae]GGH07398.1 Na(+)/H(+) antiporter NhaA [Mucilaginibacter phyllosphaerae]